MNDSDKKGTGQPRSRRGLSQSASAGKTPDEIVRDQMPGWKVAAGQVRQSGSGATDDAVLVKVEPESSSSGEPGSRTVVISGGKIIGAQG